MIHFAWVYLCIGFLFFVHVWSTSIVTDRRLPSTGPTLIVIVVWLPLMIYTLWVAARIIWLGNKGVRK